MTGCQVQGLFYFLGGIGKMAMTIPVIARWNGSQELAELMLPKTIALAAKYQGPIKIQKVRPGQKICLESKNRKICL